MIICVEETNPKRQWQMMSVRFLFWVVPLLLILSSGEAFSLIKIHAATTRLGQGRSKSPTILFKSPIERAGPPSSSFDGMEPSSSEQEKEEDDEIESVTNLPTLTLDELLRPSSLCDVNQVGSTTLAYIGDVVFELFVRSRYVWPTRRTADLQQQVVALVRAEHQSRLLKQLMQSTSFELSPKETQVLKRGRNAPSSKNRRNAAAYQDATALEALLGYLYISDYTRCEQLLNWMYAHLEDGMDEET